MNRTLLLCVGLLFGLTCTCSIAQPAPTPHADSLYQAQDWAQAAPAYQAVVDADTTNGRAWYRLGTALRNLERYDEAIVAFKGFQTNGATPPNFSLFELGKTYALMGQTEAALAHLEQAAQTNYTNLQALTTDPALEALRESKRFIALQTQVQQNAQPCEYITEYRQFDFWVGRWNVTGTQNGNQAGQNHIERIESGCILYEQWTGASGSTGKSINYYDPATKEWVQNWVSNGAIIDIRGGLEGKSMVLAGTISYRNGTSFPFRGSWTPHEDGRVRQFFEQSNDGGTTWNPWFDGMYAPIEEE